MSFNFTPGFVLYENRNRAAATHTRVVVDSDTGLPLIIKTQNTRPIVNANIAKANGVDRHVQRKQRLQGAGTTHVATVPIVVWQQWQAEGITRDETALLKRLSDRGTRYFRVDDGRKLA